MATNKPPTPEQQQQLVQMALELEALVQKWQRQGVEGNVISTATLTRSIKWAVKCNYGINAFLTEVRLHWKICEDVSKGTLELSPEGKAALEKLKKMGTLN